MKDTWEPAKVALQFNSPAGVPNQAGWDVLIELFGPGRSGRVFLRVQVLAGCRLFGILNQGCFLRQGLCTEAGPLGG